MANPEQQGLKHGEPLTYVQVVGYAMRTLLTDFGDKFLGGRGRNGRNHISSRGVAVRRSFDSRKNIQTPIQRVLTAEMVPRRQTLQAWNQKTCIE